MSVLSLRASVPFRALRSRNYRLFFVGQSISLIGTWLSRTATGWLVFRLTGSAWLLGVVGFAGQLPTLILSPVAGVLVDRTSRHRLLLLTQGLAMVQSFGLAALALTHTIQVWHVAVLSAFQGVINAFDTPARQSFVVEMVDNRDELPSAIALNSSMVNVARLIGPSTAAALIVSVGEGWCFFIDGLSYVAVLASLLLMHLHDPVAPARATSPITELTEGFRYTFSFAPFRAFLLLLAVTSLTASPFLVLMPAVAGYLLHGGPRTLGILTGSAGVGALAALGYLASRRTVLGLGRVTWIATLLFGAGLIGLAASQELGWAVMALMAAGAGMMTQTAGSNTVLQTLVDEDKRGRVMGFYTMAILGMAPLGSLLAGAIAEKWGERTALVFGGITCLVSALVFRQALPVLRQKARPIYQRLGLIPAIAEGMQAASDVALPPAS